MYSDFPKRDRIRLRAVYALIWMVLALSGVAHLIAPTPSIYGASGAFVLIASSLALVLSSVVGAAGVILGRYRLEWGSAAVATLGAIPFVVSAWWVLFAEGLGLDRTITGTLLLLYPVTRSITCLAHSNRARLAREVMSSPHLLTGSMAIPRSRDKRRRDEAHG